MAALVRACSMATLAVAVLTALVEDTSPSTGDPAVLRTCSSLLQVGKTAGLQPDPVDPETFLVDDPESEEIREKEEAKSSWATCTTPYRPCVDGHRMPPTCAYPFHYSGTEHQACLPSGWGLRNWCSIHSTYRSWLQSGQRCVPCTEESLLPKDGEWEAIARDFACTPIVITGGSMSAGRVFTFINGFPPDTVRATFPLFSGGKWPGTVAIAGAVHARHLSFDTRAADVFEWWTKDVEDPKYRVTLRHLLQFSSGFYTKIFMGMGHVQIPCMHLKGVPFDTTTTMEECAKEVYEKADFNESRIGKWVDQANYNSMHQVIALAMATKRTGLHPTEYLRKYLYEPAGMTHTTVLPEVRPMLSAGMISTVDDYDSFLSKYLTYQILPKEIVDVMEADSGNGGGEPPGWINAMGMMTVGTTKRWGGSIYASVDRSTQTYQLLAPSVKEYPGLLASVPGIGASSKWEVMHSSINHYLAQLR